MSWIRLIVCIGIHKRIDNYEAKKYLFRKRKDLVKTLNEWIQKDTISLKRNLRLLTDKEFLKFAVKTGYIKD